MVFGIPLAIWAGILTIISLFTTAGFGIAYHVYKRPVFSKHKFFAFLTLTLALIHAVLAILLWFFGIAI